MVAFIIVPVNANIFVSLINLEPGAVKVDMKAVNLTCISLSWARPDEPNGIITNYKVTINWSD